MGIGHERYKRVSFLFFPLYYSHNILTEGIKKEAPKGTSSPNNIQSVGERTKSPEGDRPPLRSYESGE